MHYMKHAVNLLDSEVPDSYRNDIYTAVKW